MERSALGESSNLGTSWSHYVCTCGVVSWPHVSPGPSGSPSSDEQRTHTHTVNCLPWARSLSLAGPGFLTCEQGCCHLPGPQGCFNEPEGACKALYTEPILPSPPSTRCDPCIPKTPFVKMKNHLQPAGDQAANLPPSSCFSLPSDLGRAAVSPSRADPCPTPPGTSPQPPLLPRPPGITRAQISPILQTPPLNPNPTPPPLRLQPAPHPLLLQSQTTSASAGVSAAVVSSHSFVSYILNTRWLVGRNATDDIHRSPLIATHLAKLLIISCNASVDWLGFFL